mmetsp:Transcript_74012/g.166157  ORF Transcript_74012/g.166157 Transcript_74012/m.166157 type:complete len:429 (-) Transcript_74012:160-1446(-)
MGSKPCVQREKQACFFCAADEDEAAKSVVEERNRLSQGVHSHDPFDALRRVLVGGSLKLVHAHWLLKQIDGWVPQRMQDLPSEAFVDSKEAELCGKCGLIDETKTLVAVSHAWLSTEHPDPLGFHMHQLQRYLEIHRNFIGAGTTCGVFMDFLSLPQGKRSRTEQAVFNSALKVIHLLYSHPGVIVVQLKSVPMCQIPSGRDTPYYRRGWCRFEEIVSCIIKPSYRLLDLAKAGDLLEDDNIQWFELRDHIVGTASPPLHPDDMDVILSNSSFTNGADVQSVSEIYRSFFADVCPQVEELDFRPVGSEGWGVAEAQQLAGSLPRFHRCKSLLFSGCESTRWRGPGHPFKDKGIQSLATAIKRLTSLETLILGGCKFGERGIDVLLSEGVLELPNLEILSLPPHLKDTRAGCKIMAACEKSKATIKWST